MKHLNESFSLDYRIFYYYFARLHQATLMITLVNPKELNPIFWGLDSSWISQIVIITLKSIIWLVELK